MPFLTAESLPSIAEQIEAHFALYPEKYKAPSVYALKYGSENSYLLVSRYTQLAGSGISPTAERDVYVEGSRPMAYQKQVVTVAQQLEKILTEAKTERAKGREWDVVIFIEQEYAFNNVWAHAAKIDADARACEEKRKVTSAQWNEENLRREAEFESAHKAFACAAKTGAQHLECLECGATYAEAGHVDEPDAMGCDRCN